MYNWTHFIKNRDISAYLPFYLSAHLSVRPTNGSLRLYPGEMKEQNEFIGYENRSPVLNVSSNLTTSKLVLPFLSCGCVVVAAAAAVIVAAADGISVSTCRLPKERTNEILNERVSERVGVRESERECVCERERERESMCVYVYVCVCVCVCVRERERESK